MVEPGLIVRAAAACDINALAELERQGWPPEMAVDAEQIAARMSANPEAYWVAELDGRIIAACAAQCVTAPFLAAAACRYDMLTDHDRFTASHTVDGEIFQLVGVTVTPEFRGRNLGRQLVDQRIFAARRRSETKRILGFTRPAGFHRYPELDIETYLALRTESGEYADPVIQFHMAGGAHLVSVHAGFRPEDHQSRGYGVLIEYPLK